jgi:hypothetical protein
VFVSEEGGTLDSYIQLNTTLVDEDMNGCPDEYEEGLLDCKVTQAVPLNPKIRVIVDELLDGSTVEEFICACFESDAQEDCGGVSASINAADCPDRPNTPVNEQGFFRDINADGVPDNAQILPDLLTVTCGGAQVFATSPGQGFYNPSGNQQLPVGVIGGALLPDVEKLGPAIVAIVPELPTSEDCFVTVANSGTHHARDKDGIAIPALPVGPVFTTAAFHVLSTSPSDGATGVDATTIGLEVEEEIENPIQVEFNANVKADSVITGVTLREMGGDAVAGEARVDGNVVTFVPEAALEFETTYELVITADVLTNLDDKPTTAQTVTFTTGAAPKAP